MYAKPTSLILTVIFPIDFARNTGNLEIYGSKKKTITPVRLNRKCTMAKLIAASDWKTAASKAVKVVPMLAPIMNWKAFLIFTLPVATSGTIKEVVRELDCETEVMIRPHENARYLFLKTIFSNRSLVLPMSILYSHLEIDLIQTNSKITPISNEMIGPTFETIHAVAESKMDVIPQFTLTDSSVF